MAQLTTVLANTYLVAAQGGPEYSTTVFDGSTGVEHRNVGWSTPRHVWQVTFGGKLTELAAVQALHLEAKGQAYSFLWTPPGYSQGSFRFASDDLKINIHSSNVAGVYLAQISFPLIQVLGE